MVQSNGSLTVQDVLQLRSEGLTDQLIVSELMKKGYNPQQVQMVISQADSSFDADVERVPSGYSSQQMAYPPLAPQMPSSGEGNVYERIQEITQNLIDEKWDELLAEVKKIVEWKEKIEERQLRMESDLTKLKDDFTVLHQGVLGKLEEYDTRMRDVGTELKAVGKVFKDVVPEFVENVKELSSLTERMKK